jgi:hypothetical protein
LFSGSGELYGFGKSSRNAENPNPRNEKRKKLGRGQERILESAEKEIEKAYEERGEGREGHSARVLHEAEPRASKNSIQFELENVL